MSFDPFGHSPDLARLATEGFELEITPGAHLLIKGVPFRTQDGSSDRGTLVTTLVMNGDATVNPVDDHTMRFIGSTPCNGLGHPHKAINNSTPADIEVGLSVDHHLSSKLPDDQKYPDYYEKVIAYVNLFEAEARQVDPTATARSGRPIVVNKDDWPFEYVDTASGRAGIGAISGKLAGAKIAIVGLGGTGSYILDLVAKCPVAEIHLFDGDYFSTHNAFRAPGAPSLEVLRDGEPKVVHFARMYAHMKRGIVPHHYHVDGTNVAELSDMTFVFIAIDGGPAKRLLVDALETMELPFVDSSLGVNMRGDSIVASVEINGSTVDNRATLHDHVDFGPLPDDDLYNQNIQIADLNSLNATMAVIWWKKWARLVHGPEPYHHQRLNVSYCLLVNS